MSGDSPRWLPPGGGREPSAWIPPAEASPSAATATPAEWWPRAGAAVVDFFVRLAILLAASLVGAVGYAAGTEAGEVTVLVGNIIGIVVAYAYAPVMIARTGGQTVGHRTVHTRIVRADGTPLSGGMAGVRELLVKGLLFEGVSLFLALIPTLVNYLWPLWDEHNEALHDKICQTRVVEA